MDSSGGARARPEGEGRAAREDDLDALFRGWDEGPAPVPAGPEGRQRAGAGLVVLGIGVVLIGIGFLAIPFLGDPQAFLPVFLTVNVAAVACVAAGLLLLPQPSKPSLGSRP